MGSNTKKSKHKDKEPSKRRHRSRSSSVEVVREKEKVEKRKHHHHSHKKHHHRDKKHKSRHHASYEGGEHLYDDVPPPPQITGSESPPPPPSITIRVDSSPDVSDNDSSQNNATGGGGAESLSIEETNRLRAKLGLKPLQVESKQTSDGKRKDDLGEFYHKPAANISEKTHQEKIRNRLAERKDRRKIEQKLAAVRPLGESDSDDDAQAWVSRNRKIQDEKAKAAKRAKMLEELDEELGVGQLVEAATKELKGKAYTQKNLKGLRVEHDVDAFKEGSTTILTLKDKAILEDEGDVLVNVNLIDNERYEKNIKLKKTKPDYNPYDQEEVDEYGVLKRKELLEKYDEEIDGAKKNSFEIGYDNSAQRRFEALEQIKAKLANKRIESLALPELKLASDYYSEAEMVKFKKPKKKVRKIRQKGKMLKADELEVLSRGSEKRENDYLQDVGSRRRFINENYIDIDDVPSVKIDNMVLEPEDNELEMALHKARMLKLQAPKVVTKIEPVKMEVVDDDEHPVTDDLGNITLNSTAEFCRTLGDIPTYGRAGNRAEEEDLLDFERELKEEKQDYNMEEPIRTGGTWTSVDLDKPTKSSAPVVHEIISEAPILDEEPDVGSGVAAALQLAMSKGYLDKEDNNRPSTSRFAHLQAKNYSIEDKTHGMFGEDDKFGRRDRYSGPTQDFKEKDQYKPNVKLDYIDDEGHLLTQKEAFRYLSHKFHGKGPGKNKIEKRIKKNEQESLMKKMSSTDTPLGTLNMLQAKQKETQSAYIVLSGANKNQTNQNTISKMKR